MYGIESSNASKKEELFDNLLTSIEKTRLDKDVRWIFMIVPEIPENPEPCEHREIREFIEPPRPRELQIIILGRAWKKWVIENWQRITPYAKSVILQIAKEDKDLSFLVGLKHGILSDESNVEELVNEIKKKG
jgi:hypothetical protein